ncbi:T9SS type A sorting domain-containing protein [candidate division KSB1 bacterium]|nr:T9SS type A sorting domain-containing protein [candidate division KSB1 bacterium]
MKQLVFTVLLVALFAGLSFAGGWVFDEAVVVGNAIATDEGEAAVNAPGFRIPYGVDVDNDGNVWFHSYYQRRIAVGDDSTYWPDDLTIPSGDSTLVVGTYPIMVLEPATGNLDVIQFLDMPDGTVDTTWGSGRGMARDPEGNIIVAVDDNDRIPAMVYQIDPSDYSVLNAFENEGQNARPAVDAEGFVYTFPLLGGALNILDPFDFSVYNSIPGVETLSRGICVSADGKDIYLGSLNGGIIHFHSDDGVDGTYEVADTLVQEINGTTIAPNYVEMDPNGLLWFGTVEEAAMKILWALDPAQDYAIVDSTSFTWWGNTAQTDTTTGGYAQPKYVRAPRDGAFNTDGTEFYLADMYSYVIKKYVWDETAAVAKEEQLPREFMLGQNYPNPFNPSTTIPFTLDEMSKVELRVYDILGHEIATLINQNMSTGNHMIEFDASEMASGTYYYKLVVDGQMRTRKMMLVK